MSADKSEIAADEATDRDTNSDTADARTSDICDACSHDSSICPLIPPRRAKKSHCSPRLETMLMVERFIQSHSGQFTRFQIWRQLPRKMMYQTFQIILAYLEDSHKISTAPDGKIFWTNGSVRPKEGLVTL